MTPRLLILTSTHEAGGAERYLATIAAGAVRSGWEVIIAFELSPRTRAVAEELRDRPGVAFVNAPIRDWHRWGVIGQALLTLGLSLRSRAAVAMVVLPWPTRGLGCVVGTALARVPAAIVFQLAPQPVTTGLWGRMCRLAQPRQRWISVSEQNRQAVATSFAVAPDSLMTIYNGAPEVEPVEPVALAARRQALRAELGVPADTTIIITVGRLTEQKGYPDLLKALPGVLAGRPQPRFVWIGEGELRSELESELHHQGLEDRVRILGHRRDVGQLLDSADLFVLPSRFEGHPFALVEALAHGVPSLSSDAGGAPEIIRDGQDGLLFRRQDPEDLTRKLSWAIDHPDEMAKLGASGRARAAAFSESRMVTDTLAVLDGLRQS